MKVWSVALYEDSDRSGGGVMATPALNFSRFANEAENSGFDCSAYGSNGLKTFAIRCRRWKKANARGEGL